MHVMKPSLSIQLYSLRDLSGIEKYWILPNNLDFNLLNFGEVT